MFQVSENCTSEKMDELPEGTPLVSIRTKRKGGKKNILEAGKHMDGQVINDLTERRKLKQC